MATTTPARSLTQRQSALRRANEIRVHRAQVKKDIKHGVVSPIDLLLDPDTMIAGMKIKALLVATPKVGTVKADRLLAREKVSPRKTIGGLSERQRSRLAIGLAAHGQ